MPIRLHIPLPGPLVYVPARKARPRHRARRRGEHAEAALVLAALAMFIFRPRVARAVLFIAATVFVGACVTLGIYLYFAQ